VVRFTRAFYPNWDSGFCEDLTRRFELEPDKRVRHLSKGTQAKLSLLLALAHRPRVLLLDEPTTGLDPIVRQEFLDDIHGLVQSEGMTVLFSSHIISDVERMADTVGILHEGELRLVASLDRLLSSTKRVRVQLRDPRVPLQLPAGTLWHRRSDLTWSLTVTDYDDSTLEFVTSRHAVDEVDVSDMNLEAIFYDTIKGSTAGRASTSLERC
jgi:ABC-2 type transport system ATP-binding protein